MIRRRVIRTITILTFLAFILGCKGKISLSDLAHNIIHVADTIDVDYIKHKVIAPVVINKVKRRFFIDTGSTCIISKDLQNEMKYKIVKYDSVFDAHGKTVLLPMVEIKELKIGHYTVNNVIAYIAPEDEVQMQSYGTDGYIGSNLLHQFAITFDMANKRIFLSTSSMGDTTSGIAMKQDEFHSPYITYKIGSFSSSMLFDSGADEFYSISLKDYDKIKDSNHLSRLVRKGFGSFTVGTFGVAPNAEKLLLNFRDFQIGSTHFREVYGYPNPTDNSRIGAKVFDYAIVTLDYINNRCYIRTEVDTIKYEFKGVWPIIPNFKDDNMIVGFVWYGGDIDSAIKVGDPIIEMNGKSTKGLTLNYFLTDTGFFKRQKITYTIKTQQKGMKRIILSRVK